MKIRLIWDDCTPTINRRPTTSEDIENDIHLQEFESEEDLLKHLGDMLGYDEDDLEDCGDTNREKIDCLLSSMDDPGDGTPNILFLSIDGDIIQDWLEEVDGLTCSEKDVKEEMMKFVEDEPWDYDDDFEEEESDESLTEEKLEEKLTWDKIEQALWSKEYNGPVHSEINYGCLRGFESRLDASQAADFIEKKFKVDCDVERDPFDNDGWVVKIPNVVDESLDEANKGSNFIDEEGRKKELSELRAILKKYLSQEKEWEEPVTEWDRNITKYDALSWYQNIRPALKNGLVKCDYKIRWSPLSDKSLQKNLMDELKAWKNKSNPNRIYSDLCKGGLDLMYNYKKFNTDESLIEADEEKTSEEPTKEEKTEPKIISDGLGQRRADKLAAMLNEENPDGVNGPFAEEPATSEDATVEISSQAGYEKTKFNDDGSIDVEYHWAEGFWNEETGKLEDLDGEETFETLEEWISHAEQNTFFLNIDLGELENVK